MKNPLTLPLRAADWFIRKSVARFNRDAESMVHEPRRARWLVWRGALGFLFALGMLLGEDMFSGTLGVLCGSLLGIWIGATTFGGLRRAMVYRDGWIEGRQQVMASLPQLLSGQVDYDQWTRAHMASDLQAMGLSPTQTFDTIDDIERRADEEYRRRRGDER